jgi:hypothetical protein
MHSGVWCRRALGTTPCGVIQSSGGRLLPVPQSLKVVQVENVKLWL